MSAEYIMAGGNNQVILCERGIRTFETYTRNTVDLSAICSVKKLSHLPVIVDPSHSTGKYWMVQPIARAAIAVGGRRGGRPDHRGTQRPGSRAVRRCTVHQARGLRQRHE